MAKNDPTPAVTAPAEEAIPLEEFCARLSETVKRPELLGAFFSSMRAQGVVKLPPSEFRAKYETFINTPV